jgi:hypothetical protein
MMTEIIEAILQALLIMLITLGISLSMKLIMSTLDNENELNLNKSRKNRLKQSYKEDKIESDEDLIVFDYDWTYCFREDLSKNNRNWLKGNYRILNKNSEQWQLFLIHSERFYKLRRLK